VCALKTQGCTDSRRQQRREKSIRGWQRRYGMLQNVCKAVRPMLPLRFSILEAHLQCAWEDKANPWSHELVVCVRRRAVCLLFFCACRAVIATKRTLRIIKYAGQRDKRDIWLLAQSGCSPQNGCFSRSEGVKKPNLKAAQYVVVLLGGGKICTASR